MTTQKRGPGRPKNPVKIPVQAEPDVRSKGTKTDQELLNEWFYFQDVIDGRVYCCLFAPGAIERQKLIEQELGTDRIQAERLRRLERRVTEIKEDQAIPGWIGSVVLILGVVFLVICLAVKFL